MSFPHEAPDFRDLLQIVAVERKLSRGVVEKDYWVTHTLWAIQGAGFELSFKGGTSLSKGFGLIQRFSEDLDLKIEPGRVAQLPAVSNWKSEGTKATAERRSYFEKLPEVLLVPGAQLALDPGMTDKAWRGATVRVNYPGQYLTDLAGVMTPFVQLEIGSARVTPSVPCDLTSFVHEKLESQGQLSSFDDNRPRGVRCVHPLVTLIEKLDALHRRFPNEKAEPATFVRHFEDAAHVIEHASRLPPLEGYPDVKALANEMLAQKQIIVLPTATDPALTPTGGPRWTSIEAAHAAIGQMFWGPRISLSDACGAIRAWLTATFP